MGVAVARELAPRGLLIVADRSLDPVQALAAELGDHVVPAACDVADQDQVDQQVARIGELGALLLTAGTSGSMGAGRQILEVNLIGTVRVLGPSSRCLATAQSLLLRLDVGTSRARITRARPSPGPSAVRAVLRRPHRARARPDVSPSPSGVQRLVRTVARIREPGRPHHAGIAWGSMTLRGTTSMSRGTPAWRISSPPAHSADGTARGGRRSGRPYLRPHIVHDWERTLGRRWDGQDHPKGLDRRSSARR